MAWKASGIRRCGGREQEALDRAGGVVGRTGSRGHTSMPRAGAGGGALDEASRSTTAARLMTSNAAPSGRSSSSRRPSIASLSVVGAAKTKTTREAPSSSSRPRARRPRRGSRARAATGRGAHATAQRREQAYELAAEVAEADDADVASGEQEAAAVGLELVGLGARAHGAIGRADAAREVDGHAERRLGHGRANAGLATSTWIPRAKHAS
jgi:hypothetical protein